MSGIGLINNNQKTYQDIIKLYDYAEMLVESVENESVKNPDEQLKILEPIIKQIEESAEILAQTYIISVETGTVPDGISKTKAEEAIKKILTVLNKIK